MKIIYISIIVIAVLITIRVLRGRFASRVERPTTQVLATYGDIQIRTFKPQIYATVTVSGSETTAPSQAFRILAGFIFGGNTSSTKVPMTAPVVTQKKPTSESISMTAPVISQSVGTGLYEVSFLMPDSYTMDTLPIPDDSRISIQQIPQKTRAVVTFDGYTSAERIKKYRNILLTQLEENNITYSGETIVAQYNDPWTPRFMRTNEIRVEVDYVQKSQ